MFWKEQGHSFAVLANEELFETFRLPVAVDDLILIQDHFFITPLIPLVQPQQFFILELDKENTQLWRGTVSELKKITLPDLPTSIAEVTGVETGERHLQFHTGTQSPSGGQRPAMFHGSSSWKDDKDRYLQRFLQAVDKAVCAFLKQSSVHLILSGTEELVVLFRKISNCGQLFEINLPKPPDPTQKERQLRQQALTLLVTEVEKKKATAVKFFEETVPDKRVTSLPEILNQAFLGKVDTLLVAEGQRVWGSFLPETLTTQIEPTQSYLSAELLNLAARLTLINNGSVIVLPAEQLPADSLVTAVLRY